MSKVIIHPTDFSECADNALQYAVEIAKATESKIAVVHSLDYSEISVTSRNAQALNENSNNLEKEAKQRLLEIGERVQKQGVPCEASIHSGRIGYWLPDYAKEKEALYIVMGTVGADTLQNKIIGSHTFDIIKKTMVPVLAVPNEASVKDFKDFVYLQDHKTPDMIPLNNLAQIGKTFNANIDVIHFLEDPKNIEDQKQFEQLQVAVKKEIDFEFNFILKPTEDLHESIQEIAKEKNPDLLALVMRHQNFFQRLFKGSLTEKLINYSHIPILVFEQ